MATMKLKILTSHSLVVAMSSLVLLGCRAPYPATTHSTVWPLPNIETESSPGVFREIRISQDLGLGGSGPLIRILVEPNQVRGEAYISYYHQDTDDSDEKEEMRQIEARYRTDYGCKPFVLTKHDATCRLPFHTQPDWPRVLATLDSLRRAAPASLPPDRNVLCTDTPGWSLTERAGTQVVHDESRFCGPRTNQRAKYEKDVWELIWSIDRAARFK